MKLDQLTKLLLLVLFSLLLLSLAGRTILPFEQAGLLLVFSMLSYLVVSIVYIILSLVKKQHRIEAGMIGLSLLMVIGASFNLMRWPGGDIFIIMGNSIMMLGSIGIFIYSLIKKQKESLAALYFALGFGSFFFCFKVLFWPGATQLYISYLSLFVMALIFLVIKKNKIKSSHIVLLLLHGIIISIYFIDDSQLYFYKNISTKHPEMNFPESYHQYAWKLYKEGKTEEAKQSIQMGIEQVKNPNNKKVHFMVDNVDLSIERYERALEQINANTWNEYEKPSRPGPGM